MKKILAVLSAMFVLACGMMMTGCEFKEALDELSGPKDRWCETVFSYEAKNGTKSDLTCHLFYSEKGVPANSNSKYKADIEIPAGLTILVVGDSTSEGLDIIAANKYVMKTLKQGASLNGDGEEVEDGKFKMNSTLWTLICTLGDSDIPNSASTTVPVPISTKADGEKYTELTELGDFSWKKILAQILINKLLEEDTE